MVKVDDLGKVSKFYRWAELDLSGAVLIPQKAPDEGGLSRAVIAQQRNPLAALDCQIHVRKQHSVSKGLGDIFHFEHNIPGKLLFSEGGLHSPLFFGLFRLTNALHAVLDGHGTAVQGSVVDTPPLHPLHGVAKLPELSLLLLILL